MRALNMFFLVLPSLLLSSCQHGSKKEPDEVFDSKIDIVRSDMSSGRHAVALKKIQNLIEAYGPLEELDTLLGIVQLSLGNKQESIGVMKEGLKRHPTSQTLRLNLSSAYIESGNSAEARRILTTLLNDVGYKKKERAYHNFGWSYHKEKRYKSAMQYYKKAHKANPLFYITYIQRARIYAHFRHWKAADRMLKQATDLCKACLEPYLLRSKVYERQNNLDKALASIEVFLRQNEVRDREKQTARRYHASLQKKRKAKR